MGGIMRRGDLVAAVLGLLLGAALVAGGQETDADLVERLVTLRQEAARLQALKTAGANEGPPPTENGFEYERLSIADLTYGVSDFIPPAPPFDVNSDLPLFGGQSEEAPEPFGSGDEILMHVRHMVHPERWEEPEAMLTCVRTAFFVVQQRDVIESMRRFLDSELRPSALRTVCVETEIVEVQGETGAAVAARAGMKLDSGLRARLEEACRAGSARRLFAGRLLGLAGQRVVLWHGAQVATLGDHDVEAGAPKRAIADPVVLVELLGGILAIRSTIAPDSVVRLQIAAEHAALDDPVRERTAEAARLHLPAKPLLRIDTELLVKSGTWAVAAEASGAKGRRFLLVRPTVLERAGGGR
jgi:hypothetical protein